MRAAALAAAVAALTPAAASTCNLTGNWTGGSATVTVVQADNDSFVASASGAWQNVSGMYWAANNSAYLDCCKPGGIYGTVVSCTQISWDDGQGSLWTRPPPQVLMNVTLSNIVPRRDDTGEILRVQDGCLARFNNLYYLYGARYQCCPVSGQADCYHDDMCGWRNTTFAVYSSPDLQSWHLESDNIFPIATDPTSPHSNTRQAYFEPCVLYSPSADHYVLWFLYTFTKAVAVSDSPTGPFESVSWDAGIPQASDAYFWADQNTGITYMKHNGPPPPGDDRGAHYVSQLSDDLLSVVNTSAPMMVPALPVPPYYQGAWPTCSEGGGIFQLQGTYYVMAGTCCCFCAGGANAFVWSSPSPMGPYTLQAGDNNVMPFNNATGKWLTQAQQFSVAALPTAQGVLPMYIGQRFGSADDGLKCHDYQYWSILRNDGTPGGPIQTMQWEDNFTVQLWTLGQ